VVSDANLKRLAGTYDAGGRRVVVTVEHGILMAGFGESSDRIELIPESDTAFLPISDGLPRFKFVPTADGHVDEIEFPGGKAKRVAQRDR
jgi:hypothetical protein